MFCGCRGARLARDIAAGLFYLHSRHIIHLDLKSPNILLADDYSARIADVGLGKFMLGPQTVASSTGSFIWAAPEQLEGKHCTEMADMFSFGTILWELVTGEQPLRRITRPVRYVVSSAIHICQHVRALYPLTEFSAMLQAP